MFVARRRGAEHRDEMAARLADGDSLILFPEGTGDGGNRVLSFESALFGVAERRLEGAPLTEQPVSIAYSELGGLPMPRATRRYFAWYGDMTMADHLWATLGRGPATVVVEFHPPVSFERFGARKALATHCQAMVAAGVSTGHPRIAAAVGGGGALDYPRGGATVVR